MVNASVLFVCMGNICRSPTGEGVFRHYVHQQGLNGSIRIDSAGTIGFHTGNRADPRMRAAASQRGYELTSLARQVTPTDLETFDLVVAMDRANYNDLGALHASPRARLVMLGAFLPEHGHDDAPDVPDPYYGGPDGFEEVLDMIEAACPALLAALVDAQAG